jgi:RimJ/RimL family protein N-acetyltransferase
MKIVLQATAISDLELVIQAERHIDNCNYVYQWSLEQHQAALTNPNQRHYIIINKDNSEFCGYIILDSVQDSSGSINFRRFVVTKKGHGIGRIALGLIKHIAFNELNAHRLWLDVFTDNIRAYELYKKVGFRTEGTLIESYLRNGEYVSQHVMAILMHEFKK